MDIIIETINKDNWTGEMGKVTYEPPTGYFIIEGLDDRLFYLDNPEQEEPGIYRVRSEGQNWFGYRCGTRVLFAESGCQREHANPYLAFAQLAWNTI